MSRPRKKVKYNMDNNGNIRYFEERKNFTLLYWKLRGDMTFTGGVPFKVDNYYKLLTDCAKNGTKQALIRFNGTEFKDLDQQIRGRLLRATYDISKLLKKRLKPYILF